jgi:hypothetical protein
VFGLPLPELLANIRQLLLAYKQVCGCGRLIGQTHLQTSLPNLQSATLAGEFGDVQLEFRILKAGKHLASDR